MKKVALIIGCVGMIWLSNLYAASSTNLSLNTATTPGKKENCTEWMLQTSGCYWRTCVDDKAIQYCQECCPDKTGKCVPSKVQCK